MKRQAERAARRAIGRQLFVTGALLLVTACGQPMTSGVGSSSAIAPTAIAVLEGDGANVDADLVAPVLGVSPDGSDGPAVVPDEAPVPEPAAPAAQQSPPDDSSGESCPPAQATGQGWRAKLAPAPLWNPPGPKRVGLQAGHWLTEQTPPELSRLQHGASGGGKQEWEVNLDIAQRAKLLLEAAGVQADILPTTVPPRYRAHVFVSIHADGDPTGQIRGFKIARPGFSSIPEIDDRLVAALYAAYESATGLPRDDANITRRMLYYYAFNSRRYCHAVAPGVPQAIVETGFLTNAADRQLLLGNPELAARGITAGVIAFLKEVAQP